MILTHEQVYALARNAGCNNAQAIIATAITNPESGRNTRNVGDQTLAKYGSRGLWQIFSGAHSLHELGIKSYDDLFDPYVNARAMWIVSVHGTTWHPWSTYNDGAYKPYVPRAAAAAKTVGDNYRAFLAGTVPVPAPTPVPVKPGDRVCKMGAQGDDVKVIQAAVGAVVDGNFGPKTNASVKAYQKKHALFVDGIVGPKTWAVILAKHP